LEEKGELLALKRQTLVKKQQTSPSSTTTPTAKSSSRTKRPAQKAAFTKWLTTCAQTGRRSRAMWKRVWMRGRWRGSREGEATEANQR